MDVERGFFGCFFFSSFICHSNSGIFCMLIASWHICYRKISIPKVLFVFFFWRLLVFFFGKETIQDTRNQWNFEFASKTKAHFDIVSSSFFGKKNDRNIRDILDHGSIVIDWILWKLHCGWILLSYQIEIECIITFKIPVNNICVNFSAIEWLAYSAKWFIISILCMCAYLDV